MRSPAPGKEENLAVIQAEDCLAGKQLCGKGCGVLAGSKLHMCQWQRRRQSILGWINKSTASKTTDYLPLLSAYQTTSGLQCPVWGFSKQEWHRQTSSAGATKMVGAGASALWGKLRTWGLFSLKKRQHQGAWQQPPSTSMRRSSRRQSQALHSGAW